MSQQVTPDDVYDALVACIEAGEVDTLGNGAPQRHITARLPVGCTTTSRRLKTLSDAGRVKYGRGLDRDRSEPVTVYAPADSDDQDVECMTP